MRNSFDFAPLWRSTVGFDHLANLVDAHLRQTTDDAYPPYNIERTGEDSYRIMLAVAGFGPDDVSVTAEQNTLTIEGKKQPNEREFLYQGIANRAFKRVYSLADYVQVKNATLSDGMLTIDLAREVPEAMKPRRIAINKAAEQAKIARAA
ncbi:Hsp20 family protein [bacterium]|nr:MAG: Hsp20 family protein [bacterium]